MMLTLASGRMGGTEVYAENLVSNLRALNDARFDVTVVRARQFSQTSSRTPEQPQSASAATPSGTPNFREITSSRVIAGVSPAQKVWAWMASLARRRTIWRDIESAAGGPIDLAFYPFTAVQPRPRRTTKTVVVVHDLQHLDMPGAFSMGQRIYRRLSYELPAKRASAVITVSDFTSASVADHLNVDTSRIHRVYPGIDMDLFQPGHRNAPDDPVLYYPARGLPHKNHARLFRAVERVRATHPRLKLILSGSDAQSLHPLPDFVVHVGNITPNEIRDLYRAVTAVVFPSLYEGFGFPPLEALATGTPVVASRAGALPEVLTDRAILVDQFDVSSIAVGIETALARSLQRRSSPKTRPELAQDTVAEFTWSKTAENLTRVFARLFDVAPTP
jgi:glycosyltransferase involved in cell wall biosynthesis